MVLAAISILAIMCVMYPPCDSDLIVLMPPEHRITRDIRGFNAELRYVAGSILKDVTVLCDPPSSYGRRLSGADRLPHPSWAGRQGPQGASGSRPTT